MPEITVDSKSKASATDATMSNKRVNTTNLALTFSQLKPFLDIAVPFFKEDKTARNSLGAVGALTLANSAVSVMFSYISRDFYTALNNRDEALFFQKVSLFGGALLIAVPVVVFYRYNREKLSIYWRDGLTKKVLEQYYSNRTFYVLETLRDIDNPDQRIADDIRAFTKTSLGFFITLFTSVVDLFSFSAILYQIYPGLFVAIIVYAVVGSIVTTRLGRALVGLNYEKLQKEANFRFSLIRTRENAEAIAFYDSNAELERLNIQNLFEEVLANQLDIIGVQRNLEYFTTGYRYLVQILPSLIVAPLYFAKQIELGAISQSYGAFNHVLGDFSLIINSFEELSAFSAGLTRLTTFLDRINEGGGWDNQLKHRMDLDNSTVNNEEIDPLLKHFDSGGSNTRSSLSPSFVNMHRTHGDISQNAPILICSNLTVYTPDRIRTLIGGDINTEDAMMSYRGVDVTINRGDSVLIVGSSGCGKSSLLRVIAGLWKYGEGDIQWVTSDQESSLPRLNVSEMKDDVKIDVAPDDVFFLPQKPYNIPGSLRLQIVYPKFADESDLFLNGTSAFRNEMDNKLLDILNAVRLGDLAARVGNGDELAGLQTQADWSKILSLGEQQRLSFARAIYNEPSVVILDESTSAMDLETEKHMYSLLRKQGVTYISVGHRPSLLPYHSRKMTLRGPGKKVEIIDIDVKESEASGIKATLSVPEFNKV